MRRGDLRIAVACAPAQQPHHIWFGALGRSARHSQGRASNGIRRVPRAHGSALSSSRRSRTYHGVRTDPKRQGGRPGRDRKSVVEGKSVSVRVDLGGRRNIKKKKKSK